MADEPTVPQTDAPPLDAWLADQRGGADAVVGDEGVVARQSGAVDDDELDGVGLHVE